MSREFELVVFGATGFTGRLVAEYLAERLRGTPVRWAIAGRSAAKLGEIERAIAAIDPLARVGVVEASVEDPASLARMAARTQVVANTVGPYARYGEAVVRACVESGADQVDITGEPEYVSGLLERWDAPARERGVRIVSCCGFDSIPHDLGALFTVRLLPRGEAITLTGVVRASGGFSGGTWHSAVEAMGLLGRGPRRAAAPPEPEGRTVGRVARGLHWDRREGGWVVPLPTIDPQIVRRSARALDDFGPDFRYGHYMGVGSTPVLVGGALALGGVAALSRFGPTRALLLKARAPGEGPGPEQRAKSWFRVTFTAKSKSKTVVTRVSGGDPGYGETAKMLAESGLCLALDRERLPGRAGVLTPAVAMGDALLARLQSRGITFERLEG
jgi:short subunit dehydrogenase-like uncharacterized protein